MNITISDVIIILGIVFSLFYGSQGVEIFQRNENGKKYLDNNISWWIHQRWINLVGSVIGWILIYILYLNLSSLGIARIASRLSLGHIFLFVFGVIGIMGFLPLAFWGLAQSFLFIADLAKKKN